MVAIITDMETDTTLHFMELNNRPQEEIDQYLQDQKDIIKILEEKSSNYSEIAAHFDHDITPALSYLAHSQKICFTIEPGGNVVYWDWSWY